MKKKGRILMKIRLCRKKDHPTRKGKYIDREIAFQLIDIGRGVRAFQEKKYAKAIQYLEKKALNPRATDRIKFIVGTSFTEINVHEKEASDLLKSIIQKYKDEPKDKRPSVYAGAMLEYAKIQREVYDFAISRAVSELNILIELCAGFVKKNGYVIAMKSQKSQSELAKAKNGIKILGLQNLKTEKITLPFSNSIRHNIWLFKKTSTTKKYPREYSKITSKPL